MGDEGLNAVTSICASDSSVTLTLLWRRLFRRSADYQWQSSFGEAKQGSTGDEKGDQ